ncbi:MAG: EamA family transporter [Candidatus Aenigmarchaeota archaeon]|nr:EamA family transporter [Candidatus Aenigmarchaeota archaeon]
MSWFLFVLLAVNLWSFSNIIDKHVVSNHVKNPMIPISVQALGIAVYIVFIALIWGISVPSPLYIVLSLFSGFLLFSGIVLYFEALKHDEVSRVMPLFATAPIFTLIFATFFLGELFTADKYIGIALLVLGSVIISYRRNQQYKFSKGVIFMLASSLIFSISYIITKYLSGSMDVLNIFLLTELGLAFFGGIVFLKYRSEISSIYRKNSKVIYFIILSGAFGFFGFLLYFSAISQGSVSLVVALDNTQWVFVLFYATLISIFLPGVLKEDLKGSVVALKLLAIAIIFAGAYLVSV